VFLVADTFCEISHKQHIRQDKISNTFWPMEPSGLYWENWKDTKYWNRHENCTL